MRSAGIAWVSVIGLVSVQCGGDSGGGATVASAQAALVEASCHYLMECDAAINTEFDDYYWARQLLKLGPADACQDAYAILVAEGFPAADFESGKLTLNSANVDACAAAVKACADFDDVAACREMADGKVATGGACAHDVECTGDAFCKTDMEMCGVCAPRLAVGQSCDGNGDCAQNSDHSVRCEWSETSNDGTCTVVASATAASGGACGWIVGADGKTTETRCPTGEWCKSNWDGLAETYACKPLIANGQACVSGDRCAVGSYCTATSEAAGTCATLAVAKLGEPCSTDSEAAPAQRCNDYLRLYCAADGKCAEFGDGSLGSTCSDGDPELAHCQSGLRCDYANDEASTGTCAAGLANGESCDESDECASGYCGDSGTCASEAVCE